MSKRVGGRRGRGEEVLKKRSRQRERGGGERSREGGREVKREREVMRERERSRERERIYVSE